jgi:FimV-like protein
MIELIFRSYMTVFLSVGVGCVSIFVLGLYCILSKSTPSMQHDNDLSIIAGDDVISTQLDLARAYIESNNKDTAKKILKAVMNQGSHVQKDEAKALVGLI